MRGKKFEIRESSWTRSSLWFLADFGKAQDRVTSASDLSEQEKKADDLFSETFSQLSENEPRTLGNQKEKLQHYLTSSQIKSRRGNHEAASLMLKDGIRLAKELLEEFPKEYDVMEYLAAFEQDMATDQNAEGQSRLAMRGIENAIRIREKLIQIGESNFENEWYLATAYRSLADIHCNLRSNDLARENADRAIEKLQLLLVRQNNNVKAKSSLASAYRTRGKILGRLSEVKEAISNHEAAAKILREVIKEHGESEQFLHSLAQTLHNHGRILEPSDPSQALSRFEEAAEIIERMAGKSSPRPKVFEDVVIILGSYGDLAFRTRSHALGIQILEKRVELAKKGFTLTNLERFKDKWVWCMNDLAQNYSEDSQLDKSRKWFDDCQALWENFSDEYKRTESYAQGYGGTLINGSMLFRKRHEYQKAMDWLDKAESLMESFAKKESSGAYIKRFYAFGRKSRARLLGQMAADLAEDSDSEKLNKALALLKQADQYDHQNTSNLALKADLYVQLKQVPHAIESLQILESMVTESERQSIRRRISTLQKNN